MTKEAPKRMLPPRKARKRLVAGISLRRFPVTVFLRNTRGAIAGRIGDGIVTDIRQVGVGITMSQPLAIGMGVVLVLNAGGPQEHVLEATTRWAEVLPCSGRVLKVDHDGSGRDVKWRIGLSFESLDKDQNEFIRDLLNGIHPEYKFPVG